MEQTVSADLSGPTQGIGGAILTPQSLSILAHVLGRIAGNRNRPPAHGRALAGRDRNRDQIA